MDHLTSISNFNWLNVITTSSSSFLLIFAAEVGDKSQLVCMALAARYRAAPVMLGSILAFLLLNSLAVTFGVTIANWLPEVFVLAAVAILFAVFGVHALRIEEDLNNEKVAIRSHGSILLGTFLLITVAEFGDKTQLAVVALSSTSLPVAVWLGSTAALIATSALGVWAGRTILQRIPITFLHRISGIIFISLAIFASYKTYIAY
ncbi:MAG: TMEM165/GDT1 family protein [Thiotrichales bacterium]|jgi:putative Ca2+/H+ antiporter (TMEM165/GDT1 family)|nr:TMEM165/GDT1 family protein [Thiotrichales bacterium]MBT5291804.1 TMEM165/GDT1 family protein [Thiotrichales bacterium]